MGHLLGAHYSNWIPLNWREWFPFRPVQTMVDEMARMGGIARTKARSKTQLRKWGKEGGRPVSLNRKSLAQLETLLHQGKSQVALLRLPFQKAFPAPEGLSQRSANPWRRPSWWSSGEGCQTGQ